MTRDLDLVIWLDEDSWADFLQRGERFGFKSLWSKPLEFAARSRIFSVRHATSRITVDLAIGGLEMEREMIRQAKDIVVDDLILKVSRPEDLIVMKVLAERDHDLRDVEGLVVKNSPLDRRYLNKRAKQMEALLDMPGFAKRVENLTKRKKK